MISLKQCAEFAGLAADEAYVCAAPSLRHRALLASYLLNLHRGAAEVRQLIVADLRGYLDLGASQGAADAMAVLRLFLSEYPEGRCASSMSQSTIHCDGPRKADGRAITKYLSAGIRNHCGAPAQGFAWGNAHALASCDAATLPAF
jgi:hypothetical protein